MTNLIYWKDKLPGLWEAVPLKAVASYAVSSVDKLTKEDEFPVELCNYVDVYKNDFITEEQPFMNATATEEEIKKYSMEDGHILITKDSESWDDIGIPALVTFTRKNLLCGYHLAMIKPQKNRLNPEFLLRCIQSKEIRIQLELASTGVTRFGLPKDEIGRLMLPVPDINIQNKIVEYLRNEISRIDLLILAKQRLLDRLSEKRQALITHAVTKGLNPKAKMKDSGIEWLGQVPEHWEVKRLKYLASINPSIKNHFFSKNSYDIVTFLPMENVSESGIVDVSIKKEIGEISNGYTYFELNDILVAKITPCFENGKGALLNQLDTNFGFGSTEFHVIRCNEEIDMFFLFFVTISSQFRELGTAAMKGAAGQQRVPPEFLKDYPVAFPSIEEQKLIVAKLKTELEGFEKIENSTNKSIELLNERRAALITAAVSGQIEIN